MLLLFCIAWPGFSVLLVQAHNQSQVSYVLCQIPEYEELLTVSSLSKLQDEPAPDGISVLAPSDVGSSLVGMLFS